MNSLVNRANKQVTNIKNDLNSLREALEVNSLSSPNTTTTTLNSQLSASLSGLQGTIRDLEMMTQNEFDPTKRNDYKAKLKLLQTDLTNYRAKFDQLKHQLHEQEKLRNREELFNTTTATSRKGQQTDPTDDVTERLISQREEEVLSNTSSRLDDFISIGMATIVDLKSQRSALKSTHQSLLNAATSLGISQSILRIIGQRSGQERAIFYFGAVLTLVVIFVLWKYF